MRTSVSMIEGRTARCPTLLVIRCSLVLIGELLQNDALVGTALWVIVAICALIAFLALMARPEVALFLGMVLGAPGLLGTVGLVVADHVGSFDAPGWAVWSFVGMAAAGFGLLAIGVMFSQRVG